MNDGSFDLDPTPYAKEITFKDAGFYWFKHPPNYSFVYEEAEICYSISFTDIEKFTRKDFWDKGEAPGPKTPFTSARHFRRWAVTSL